MKRKNVSGCQPFWASMAITLLFVLSPAVTSLAQSETVRSVSSPMQKISSASEGMSSQELLNGFVQQLLDESLNPGKAGSKTRSGADMLSEPDKKLYTALKTKIKDIAEGKLLDTEIDIPISELTDKLVWTKADLDGTDIVVGDMISQESFKKVLDKIGVNVTRVIEALLADCPYELYWFDKTAGLQWDFGTASAEKEGDDYKLTLKGPFHIIMYVSADYAQQENATKTTKVKDVVSTVSKAISKAQSIVDQYAGKSVLDRLIAYRDEICGLTSYNSGVIEKGKETPYGNPWQLVWVFDDDQSTTVACEGYAKAFKYLCDLSGFEGIECLIAQGLMICGEQAGDHMWNILRMDDGRNYLVDVTNCDEGTVGYPDKLFMAYGPEGGYTQYTIGSVITYAYDEDTKDLFGEANLTISPDPYTPTTSMAGIGLDKGAIDGDAWYTLGGYRLNGQPAESGAYIHQGRIIIVK